MLFVWNFGEPANHDEEKAWMLGELRLCRVVVREKTSLASIGRASDEAGMAITWCQQSPSYKVFQHEIRQWQQGLR